MAVHTVGTPCAAAALRFSFFLLSVQVHANGHHNGQHDEPDNNRSTVLRKPFHLDSFFLLYVFLFARMYGRFSKEHIQDKDEHDTCGCKSHGLHIACDGRPKLVHNEGNAVGKQRLV